MIFAALMTAAASTSAFAADQFIGRWAPDAKACKAEEVYSFEGAGLSTPTFGCETAKYTADGKGWKVHSSQCSGEDPDQKPYDLDFSLAVEGGKLQILWDDGSKSAKLMKCR
jgi:hypothetical protein